MSESMQGAGFHFEPFLSMSRKKPLFETVTIHQRYVRFNKLCFPRFQRKDYCRLYFDRRKKAVAIQPSHIAKPGMVKMTKNDIKCIYTFSCKKFIEEIDKMLGGKLFDGNVKSRCFPVVWDEKHQCFILNFSSNGENLRNPARWE